MVEVRALEERDTSSLLRVWTAFQEQSGGDALTDQQLRPVLVRAYEAGSGFCFLGAFDGETLVGIVSVAFAPSTYRASPFAWCDDLFVDPRWRRRGIGKALMEQVVELADRRGCSNILVATGESEQAAHDFYGALDFRAMPWRVLSRPL
jgi:GNAT superfamily N-acetyltransferase